MRKTVEIELIDRGEPRRFQITEMPATQGEVWFLKVVHLLTKANFPDLVETILKNNKEAKEDGSDEAVAAFNMETVRSICTALSSFSIEEALPLWDELLGCCVRTDGGTHQVCSISTVDAFIENPLTLMKLKFEAAKVNLNFLFEGGAAMKGISQAVSQFSKQS